MAADLHDTVSARLRADGQRYTTGRRALVEVLAGAEHPLTIAEVLDGRRDLAQSSAYRNLAVLERAGVVQRVYTTSEWARYELAEHLTAHHHHLICTACGAVADVEVPAFLEQAMERAAAEVGRSRGYRIETHRLDLVGTCPACA